VSLSCRACRLFAHVLSSDDHKGTKAPCFVCSDFPAIDPHRAVPNPSLLSLCDVCVGRWRIKCLVEAGGCILKTFTRIFCLSLWGILCLQPVQADAVRLRFGGQMESNLFLGMVPPAAGAPTNTSNLGRFFDFRNSNSLFMNVRALFNHQFSAKARVQLRNINFSSATNATDLELYEQQFPVSVRLYEMVMNFNELFGFMDLRIGQQRIAWGTATAFNPTDNLNPYNLENPLDFTERLPVPAITASFYTPEEFFKLTLAAVPFHVPSVVPFRLFKDAIAIESPVEVPDFLNLDISSVERIQRIDTRIENAQFGAKAAFTFSGVNLSASYFNGYVLFPVQETVDTDIRLSEKKAIANVTLIYPRVHVLGLDFSTSIPGVGIGVWGEFALTIPTKEINLVLYQNGEKMEKNPLTGDVIPKTTVMKNEPYLKATVGLDYTFPGGYYFIVQYMYGFFNQQNVDELHHFAFVTFRKSFLRGRLMVQLTAMGEIDATKDSGPNKDGLEMGFAGLLNPEIQIKPIDSASIILGGIYARGTTSTTLALFQDLAQVYLRARMKF